MKSQYHIYAGYYTKESRKLLQYSGEMAIDERRFCDRMITTNGAMHPLLHPTGCNRPLYHNQPDEPKLLNVKTFKGFYFALWRERWSALLTAQAALW